MIQYRNMWKQVLWFFLTIGIYGIYWFYVTSKEMVEYNKSDGKPGLWTFLLLIPYVNYYSNWKYGSEVEAVTDQKYSGVLIFILWIVFPPAVWFITQRELNKLAWKADQVEAPGEGQEPTD